jgi:hypothetical protein
MVVLNNTIAADNGAGPLQHVVNGKDTGAHIPRLHASCAASVCLRRLSARSPGAQMHLWNWLPAAPRALRCACPAAGGDVEFTWLVDDRARPGVNLTSMTGLRNSLLISRTPVTTRGTLDYWKDRCWLWLAGPNLPYQVLAAFCMVPAQ